MQFRMGGVFDGTTYRAFSSITDLLGYLMSSRFRGTWHYAHFGGMADLTFFLEHWIKRDDLTVKASFSGSSAILVHVRQGKNTWHFCDSYWLLRDSLRKIGKSVGIEKGNADESVDFYERASFQELRDYNEQDCRILYTAIERFETEINELGSNLRATIASTAMTLFRTRYLKENISTFAAGNVAARNSYHASRVEVITKHCGKGKLYDINSSFPFAMTKPVPGSLSHSNRTIPSEGVYLAHVEIAIPEMHLPPIPLRRADKIFFPTGKWRAWFSAPDIELIEASGGRITKVREVMHYNPTLALRDYALDIYERRRRETDDFRRLVYKYLLNSLYGKFAEQTEKQTLWVNPAWIGCPHDGEHPNDECITELMPGVILVTDKVDIPHEHVPIATTITANARRTLYDYLIQCENVAYCDTDSVVTTSTLPTSDALGGLKLELEFDEGEFLRPKLYRLDQRVKAKGFSRMTYDKFCTIRQGAAVEIERMMRIREMLRKGRLAPSETLIPKQLRPEVMGKRCYQEDGTSRPWSVNEIVKKLG